MTSMDSTREEEFPVDNDTECRVDEKEVVDAEVQLEAMENTESGTNAESGTNGQVKETGTTGKESGTTGKESGNTGKESGNTGTGNTGTGNTGTGNTGKESGNTGTGNTGKETDEELTDEDPTDNDPSDGTKDNQEVKMVNDEGMDLTRHMGNIPSVYKPTETKSGLTISGPDQYKKVRLIGRGDVGKVYLCEVKDTTEEDRFIAVKIMKKKDMIKRNKVKRVLTEREILATTNHPFITSMYASFQTSNELHFVMEYCAGGEFFRLLQRQPNRCLSEDVAKFYAAEVLLALEYLHMMGFIYRDLKPENILIHASGHIRLTDFDLSTQTVTTLQPTISKSLLQSLKSSKLKTKQVQEFNSFVGTVEFVAPEVLTGSGHSSSVDWWTFGILLYEMLYGRTPFLGKNQQDTFNNILKSKIFFPPTPSGQNLSKQCKNLIKKLLNPDKNKRLGTKNGASDIKNQAFFKEINWALIRNLDPPLKPKVKSFGDFSYFKRVHDSTSDDELLSETRTSNEKVFAEFEYVRNEQSTYGKEKD